MKLQIIVTISMSLLFALSTSCSKQGIDKHCGKIAAISVLFIDIRNESDDTTSQTNEVKSFRNDWLMITYWAMYNDCLEHSPSRIGGYD